MDKHSIPDLRMAWVPYKDEGHRDSTWTRKVHVGWRVRTGNTGVSPSCGPRTSTDLHCTSLPQEKRATTDLEDLHLKGVNASKVSESRRQRQRE